VHREELVVGIGLDEVALRSQQLETDRGREQSPTENIAVIEIM